MPTPRPARPTFHHRLILPAGVLALAGFAASADNCTPTGSCIDCHAEQSGYCNEQFDQPLDGPLRQACINAAGDLLLACLDGGPSDETNAAWLQLYLDLQECEQQFEHPPSIQDCADRVYEEFKEKLDDIMNPDDDDCRENAYNPLTGGYTYTFSDFVNSGQPEQPHPSRITAEIGAMINLPGAGAGPDRDVAVMPCVKSAHLVATYRTKNSVVTEFAAYDGNPADGTPMQYYLDPAKLIHADQVVLVAVFMDAHGVPVFFESGSVAILDSVITGDYNRDGLTNNLDLLDYIDAYGSEIRRADLNQNQAVETNDLSLFVTDFSAGF